MCVCSNTYYIGTWIGTRYVGIDNMGVSIMDVCRSVHMYVSMYILMPRYDM